LIVDRMTKDSRNVLPLISVVIPTYNRAYCLERTIKSVLAQTYPHWEMIIVDNHSTDNTYELIASFNEPRIKVLKIHNKGVIAASRNKGLYAAQGKYVAFLDSDDWWLPEKLQASIEQLAAGADIVYHDLYMVSTFPPNIRFYKRARTKQVKRPVFHDLLFNGNSINNSSVVVKRELMNQIGGFSEDSLLIAAEDYDAWLRLAKITEAFVRLNKPFGFYWVGGGNISSAKRTIQNLERLLEIYCDDVAEDCVFSSSAVYAYVMGKAKYELGQFNDASVNFRKAVSLARVGLLLFKALIWLIRSEIKKRFNL